MSNTQEHSISVNATLNTINHVINQIPQDQRHSFLMGTLKGYPEKSLMGMFTHLFELEEIRKMLAQKILRDHTSSTYDQDRQEELSKSSVIQSKTEMNKNQDNDQESKIPMPFSPQPINWAQVSEQANGEKAQVYQEQRRRRQHEEHQALYDTIMKALQQHEQTKNGNNRVTSVSWFFRDVLNVPHVRHQSQERFLDHGLDIIWKKRNEEIQAQIPIGWYHSDNYPNLFRPRNCPSLIFQLRPNGEWHFYTKKSLHNVFINNAIIDLSDAINYGKPCDAYNYYITNKVMKEYFKKRYYDLDSRRNPDMDRQYVDHFDQEDFPTL